MTLMILPIKLAPWKRRWKVVKKIPIGVLYENPERNVFGHRFRESVAERPLPELDPVDAGEIKRLFKKFGPETE